MTLELGDLVRLVHGKGTFGYPDRITSWYWKDKEAGKMPLTYHREHQLGIYLRPLEYEPNNKKCYYILVIDIDGVLREHIFFPCQFELVEKYEQFSH